MNKDITMFARRTGVDEKDLTKKEVEILEEVLKTVVELSDEKRQHLDAIKKCELNKKNIATKIGKYRTAFSTSSTYPHLSTITEEIIRQAQKDFEPNATQSERRANKAEKEKEQIYLAKDIEIINLKDQIEKMSKEIEALHKELSNQHKLS